MPIDAPILDLAERFCHLFQRLTGRTNVWLAIQLTNLSIIVYFVAAAAYFALSDVVIRAVLVVFCSGLLYLLTQTIFKVPVELYENSAYQRVAKGLRNPRRIRDAMLRVLFLSLAVLLAFPTAFVYVNLHLSVVLLTYSLIILTTVVLYLLACDPLPPCTGKVMEWLRGSAPVRATPEEARVPEVRRLRGSRR
jgi:hypothetical protein